jgi:hypothetical protein
LLIEKVRDIVGLYRQPPTRAVVFCVDETSQIQALDRTQPVLPMRPGQRSRVAGDMGRQRQNRRRNPAGERSTRMAWIPHAPAKAGGEGT